MTPSPAAIPPKERQVMDDPIILENVKRAGQLLLEAAELALKDKRNGTPEDIAALAHRWVVKAIAPMIAVTEYKKAGGK